MTENVLKIKIERNVYGGGALNFYIFNPETDEYEGKNAVSDENRLLKYTSDTRDLTEYAREMLSVLADTYRRIDRIEIHFYGILEDADILSAALNDVIGTDTRITLIPHCDISPEELLARLNGYIDSLNKKIDQFLSSEAFLEYAKTEKEPVLAVAEIPIIEGSRNTAELIEGAHIALKQIKGLGKELNRGADCIRTSRNQHRKDAAEHLSQVAALTDEFKALFSSLISDLTDPWKSSSALIECYRHTLDAEKTFAGKHGLITNLSGEDVKQLTFQFTSHFLNILPKNIKETLLSEFGAICVKVAEEFSKRYAGLCGSTAEEADIAHLLRRTVELDGIIFNIPAPDPRKYIHSGKPDGLFDRFEGVRYDNKTKTFSIDFYKYAERFNNKPDLFFYYTESGVKQAITYLTDNIFKTDFETAVRGLPDRKNDRLKESARICKNLAEKIDALSAEVNKQKDTIYAQLHNTKEGGLSE